FPATPPRKKPPVLNRHLRSAVVATAAITAGLLTTACQNGTDGSASGTTGTGAAAAVEKAAGSTNSKGVSASFKNGKVTYIAPGKYIVSVPGKGDQQFLLAEDTGIWGYGDICGGTSTDEGGQGGTRAL
ncbi:hypothetical protein ACFU6H_29350, partial [Streptomyces phaeoluteigriseus]